MTLWNPLHQVRRFVRSLALTRSARRHALVGQSAIWKMKRKFQMDFLQRAGLQPQYQLLDIGCGTLRGGVPIIRYLDANRYFGVETREETLKEARAELVENDLTSKCPTLLHTESLDALDVDVSFDVIWAFSVLIHLTDEIVEDCFRLVRRCLKPTGCFYANVNIGERVEGRWQGFPVVWRHKEFYEDLAARQALDMTDMGDLESLGHHSGVRSQDAQRMLAFRPARITDT